MQGGSAMYKAFVFLFFLVVFSGAAGQTIGQVSRNEAQPATEANRLVKEGVELTEAGQFAQAIRALEDATKLDPNYADAYAALGRAYFKMRQWRRAVDYLHRASALKAKQQQAQNSVTQQQSAPAPNPPIKPNADVATLPAARPSEPSPTPTSPSPSPKSNLVEETQRTAPEVTQPEKKTAEASPTKNDAAKASEEIPEPTGDTVSMSAAPTSSTVEGPGVSPIPLKPSTEDNSLTKIYRVGPGDVLDVRINEAEPRESTLFTVTSNGMLEHPLFAEPLNVSALTTEEVETKIQGDLKRQALIEDPKVSVGVRDYASHAILVSGLVKDSGTKFLRREAIPLYVVVADAQPLPEAAKVTVMRNEQNQMFEIDLTKVEDMGLLVRPGDVINLERNETQFVYVGGEVKAPGEKIFRRGLTLTQAIISAGGMTPKSKVAEIGRDDGQGFLIKTSFKLEDIHTGKAMDPLIKPGDRIMILR